MKNETKAWWDALVDKIKNRPKAIVHVEAFVEDVLEVDGGPYRIRIAVEGGLKDPFDPTSKVATFGAIRDHWLLMRPHLTNEIMAVTSLEMIAVYIFVYMRTAPWLVPNQSIASVEIEGRKGGAFVRPQSSSFGFGVFG